MPNFIEILREIRLNTSLLASRFFTLLLELWHLLLNTFYHAFKWSAQLIYNGYRATNHAARYIAQRMQTIFRAHFHILGQFTAPFETEMTQVMPPKLSDLGLVEQIIFSPMVALAWCSALILVPPFYNTFFTLRMGFVQISNLALLDKPMEQFHQPKEYPISWLRRLYGLMGYLTGGFFGVLTAVTIIVARSTYESFFTLGYILAQVMNLGFYFDSERMQASPLIGLDFFEQDSFFQRWILGLPGALLGATLSPLAFTQALGRVIWLNSLLSATMSQYFIHQLLSYLFDPEEQVLTHATPPPHDRSLLQQYLWGLPGMMIGGVFHLLSTTISLTITKTIHNSLHSGISVFYALRNMGLPRTAQYSDPTRHYSPRTFLAHCFGIPGLLFGISLGLVYKIGAFAIDTIYHSLFSYCALAGSLLNPSLGEKPYFSGLRGDKRPLIQQLWGGLGYIAALTTAGPMSAALFTVRVIFPVTLALITGTLFAPLTFLRKSYLYFFDTPRFKAHHETQEPIIQKLKNLNSSLTPWGFLPENTMIKDQQDGHKGSYCFIRKTLTLNTPTNTERVLDILLEDYRRAADPSRYFTEFYRHTLEKLKLDLAKDDFLESHEQVLARNAQINQLGDFVADYVNDKTKQVPSIYPKMTTCTEVFLGYDMQEKLSPRLFL